ncbi:GntR family transcriptional regulator [Candidimonas nitroreducens]|uniref:GntR family transcriptional regulator n=1 Tax=Candidimonas nitroreducens TaxID=683354 RepID=A0A225M3F2_9BURK|nr:GntR family transcriptional regulator [Candidimonas nitroreducens]OWT54763.1 GntR family transcriptional regulator [Candidimonas nitroreducens]
METVSTKGKAQAAKPPLYRRLAGDLAQDILDGVYAVGSVLPTEVELARSLKASRGSLRQALQLLAEWGMVERARKVGTRVLRQEPVAGYVQRMSGWGDTLGFAGDTVMRIDDVSDVSQPDEPGLASETSASGYWLRLTGARHLPRQAEVSTWTRVYVPGPLSGIRPLLRPEMNSIYEAIEQVYDLRVTRLRHKVTAIALPAAAAPVLGLPESAPVLEVQAWLYSEDGRLVEFVRSIHNPALYSMEFMTQSGV